MVVGEGFPNNLSRLFKVKEKTALKKNESSALCALTQGFDFEAMHNGVRCIESLASEDRGTARQYRFTVKAIEELHGRIDRDKNYLSKYRKVA